MSRPPVVPGWLGLVVAGVVSAVGCSKNPTLVDILVHADDAVPAVTTLQITLTQAEGQHSGLYRSVISDTEAGTEPFHFPATVEFNFAGAAASSATILIEALDSSSVRHVVATGTRMVVVEPNRTVDTDVTLSVPAPPPPDADAGVPDAGVADAGDEAGTDGDAVPDASEGSEPTDASDDADDAAEVSPP